jgi:release factor glutamine methyltransferase
MARPDLADAATLGEAWLMLRGAFRSADLETADLDARLLTARLAGVEPHQLVTGGDAPLGETVRGRLAKALDDRLAGMPVHRILGFREFYGLSLGLSPATLEPRPDTETLIDAVLPLVREKAAATGSCSIADLGIGTGAIGLALLSECPQATCLGVDVSADAVKTALENARQLGLSKRYGAIEGNWLSGIDAQFDLIVSNPPYIPTADLSGLSREVTEHDPVQALDGGTDGLDAYRVIASQAGDRLVRGGYLAVEFGIGQGASVSMIFSAHGFAEARMFRDFGGVERVLLFTMQGEPKPLSRDF